VTAASAVQRTGSHAPVLLLGTPVTCPPEPGAASIILGWDRHGDPVILTATSIEWLDDLEAAVQAARAQGIVEADMAVPR
jgi:hypothetical protein